MAMLGVSPSGVNPRLALALLCAVALAHAHDKRAEMSPAPFTFAARYGRSPERLITPRNDRWMMTTRYGKRSDSSVEDSPPSSGLQEPPPSLRKEGREERVTRTLSCEYTGVLMLYRCSRINGRALTRAPFVHRRSVIDPGNSEQE